MATGRGRAAEVEAPSKKPTVVHEKFAEFIEAETGVKVSPRSVMLVLTMNGAYRESDEYADAMEAVEASRANKAQAKVDARNARIKARADKIRAQLEAVEAELGGGGDDDEDEAPAPRRRGRPAAKTVAAPARRGRPAKSAPTKATRRAARVTEDDEEASPAPRRRGRPRKSTAAPTAKRGNLRAVEAPVVEDPEDGGVNAPDVEDY